MIQININDLRKEYGMFERADNESFDKFIAKHKFPKQKRTAGSRKEKIEYLCKIHIFNAESRTGRNLTKREQKIISKLVKDEYLKIGRAGNRGGGVKGRSDGHTKAQVCEQRNNDALYSNMVKGGAC